MTFAIISTLALLILGAEAVLSYTISKEINNG